MHRLSHHRVALALAVSLLASLAPATAQAASRLSPALVSKARPGVMPLSSLVARGISNGCQAGIIYDDGSAENGISFDVSFLDAVMRFDVGQSGVPVDQTCICWTRLDGPADVDFDMVFYAADGPGGEPGTFLGSVAATAFGVPIFPDAAFYSLDLRSEGIITTTNNVYVGASWLANTDSNMFLCTDEDGPGGQPMFVSNDLGVTWTDLADVDPATRAFMIRADFGSNTVEPFTCVPNATTLCLSNNRFQVQVDWATTQATSGAGQAVALTNDTGYFWFFNEENVEMVIKVLDACPVNDRFWVFAGGLTNVQVEITVTDSQTGEVRAFNNPQSTPFQPIQDTSAFATCP